MRASPILPNEILLTIFRLVEDKGTLVNLLCTSRLSKSLVEPLLFLDVKLLLPGSRGTRPRTSRIAHLAHTELFQQRIEADNGRLASFVKSLATHVPEHVETILPRLINLRRLKFIDTRPYFDVDLLCKSLSPHTRLTHFMYRSHPADMTMFAAFLEDQPTLEYLHFVGHGTEDVELTLSSDALPLLRTLVIHFKLALSVLRNRNVPHLEVCIDDEPDTWPTDIAFEKVTTLSCSDIPFGALIDFAALFHNLQYLEIQSDFHPAPLANTLSFFHLLTATKIEYISIIIPAHILTGRDDGDEDLDAEIRLPDDVTATFKRLPTLRVLDVEVDYFSLAISRFFRYHADGVAGNSPIEVDRPRRDPRSWEMWWEGCKLDSSMTPVRSQ